MDGNTPLHEAAAAGTHEAARRLLEAGASAPLQNAHGKTAAAVAREAGYQELGVLLAAGETDS